MFNISKEEDNKHFVLRGLFHLLCGLAVLYFLSNFPFPTADFIYEQY